MSDDAEYDTLVDLIFDKDALSAADFEIAFTATLATIVLATLNAGSVNSDLMKAVSIFLLLLTLLRRMIVTSRYSSEDWFLKVSLVPLELLIILVFFHSFYAISQIVNSTFNLAQETLFLTTVLIPEAVILLIVVQEMLFGNYMIWWGSFSMARAIKAENTLNRTLGGITALLALRASKVNQLPEELNEVEEIFQEIEDRIDTQVGGLGMDSDDVFRIWHSLLLVLLFIVLGIVYLGSAFLLSFLLGSPTDILLLFFSIFCVRHLVRFYYIAHGLPTERQIYSGVKYKVISYVIYVPTVLLLFS
jgi:hypothetical protein